MSQPMQCVFSPLAEHDLEEIGDYTAHRHNSHFPPVGAGPRACPESGVNPHACPEIRGRHGGLPLQNDSDYDGGEYIRSGGFSR